MMEETTFRPDSDELIEKEGTADIWRPYPNDGVFYDKIDEEMHDGDSTYIQCYHLDHNTEFYKARFGLDGSTQSGEISKVTVNAYVRRTRENYGSKEPTFKFLLRTHDSDYLGDETIPAHSYTLYSREYPKNPDTDDDWTWEEVEDLEAGLSAKGGMDSKDANAVRCTQFYVVVEYDPAPAVTRRRAGFMKVM